MNTVPGVIRTERANDLYRMICGTSPDTITSSGDAATVLQSAIDISDSGTIILDSGDYPLTGSTALRTGIALTESGKSSRLILTLEITDGAAITMSGADGVSISDLSAVNPGGAGAE